MSTILKIVPPMTAKIHQLFPTLVYQNNLDCNKEYILDVLRENNYFPSGYGTGELEGKVFLHLDQDLDYLFDTIADQVGEYLDSLCILKSEYLISVTKSWVSVSGNNNFVPMHYHSCAHLTFVYYVDLEEPADPIWFCIDKNPNECFGDQLKSAWRRNSFNTNEIFFDVAEGDLFIFPGSLRHYTSPKRNQVGKRRISIAGDIILTNTKTDLESGLVPPQYWKVF